MQIRGPITSLAKESERILRTLPKWFGDEKSLLEYAANTDRLPTFVAEESGEVLAFLSLRRHFEEAWEIDCMAVASHRRGSGVGRKLHSEAEGWLKLQGARVLQVKTLAESHPSPEYAETRQFYRRHGFRPLEVFPHLWAPHLPVLLMVKDLAHAS